MTTLERSVRSSLQAWKQTLVSGSRRRDKLNRKRALQNEQLEARQLLTVAVGHVDDFDDGTTQGWQIGPRGSRFDVPLVASPSFDGSDYLRYQTAGPSGPTSRLAILNLSENWTGDYISEGVTEIRAQVANFGEQDMFLRVGLGTLGNGPGGLAQEGYVSSDPIAVVPSGQWQTVSFSLTPENMVGVGNVGPYEDVLSNVTQLRIFSAQEAQWQGEVNAGVLGLDNLGVIGDQPNFIEVDNFPNTVGQLLLDVPPTPGIVATDNLLPPLHGDFRSNRGAALKFDDLNLELRDIVHRPLPETQIVPPQVGEQTEIEFQTSLRATAIFAGESAVD